MTRRPSLPPRHWGISTSDSKPRVGRRGDGPILRKATRRDVTIHYPQDPPGFWEFLQGKCPNARMRVDAHHLSAEMRDPDPSAQRAEVGAFIEELWRAKDVRLGEVKAERP